MDQPFRNFKSSLTGLGGVPALVNISHTMGLFEDIDALLPPKERARGYARSASVLDLMQIPMRKVFLPGDPGFIPRAGQWPTTRN